jgi:uncharacterized protein YyaL (SSP411 family)
MAHESFEDEAIAQQINASFIPIKVDREERPDVDAFYMAATQLVSGHGGWPMSVFLLPDGKPFLAGTYYPPTDRNGQVGFPRLLSALSDAWTSQRAVVEEQANKLSEALEREIAFVDHLKVHDAVVDLKVVRQKLRDELVKNSDSLGGFGGAPKFPRPSYVEALLEFNDEETRDVVTTTLNAMSREGMYDHLRGGFARYSVDAQWHVPHFEKMLCDQGLLARAYLQAAKHEPASEWRDVALDTMNFVLKDLRIEKGFASSLDADAGGEEGSHVTWTPQEIADAVGDAAITKRILDRYRITDPGLFEGKSIPRLSSGEPFSVPQELAASLKALRRARSSRVQPGRDEKVILEWNAMFASACLRSDDEVLIAEGTSLLDSLRSSHFSNQTWWRTENLQAHATASDLAWLLDSYIDAFECTGDDTWASHGGELASYLVTHHWDGEVPTATNPNVGRGFFTQSDHVQDLPSRPKEIFDVATPSSHAVACRAIARLALCLGDNNLLCISQRLVELASSLVATHPGSVPDLVDAAGYALRGVEIVIPGAPNELSKHVRSLPMVRSVLITGNGSSPLLSGRSEAMAYVCRAGVCQLPVSSIDELTKQLREAGAL